MHSFSEAFDLLLKHTPLLPIERLRIEVAAGRVLRQEIRADRDVPAFDRVMMDGYALRSPDLLGCRVFLVAGQAPAGRETAILPEMPGSCLEVMTGAPLPIGADCIVPVEETTRTGTAEITVASSFEYVAGRFIHARGSDAREGDLLLESGILLGSREIGVAASCGAAWLEVSRKPVISIFTTGDELVSVDETPAPHQIRQSNGHAIRCALERAGHPPGHVETLADDTDAARGILEARLAASDFVVLTGAVSKGSRDFIPGLLDSLGCTRLFHGVAQRPGKPAGAWIGPIGQVVMALPGNPVSALTGLHAFVLPALAVASGLPVPKPRLVIPAGRMDGLSGMTQHLPVTLGTDGRVLAAPTGNSGDFIGLLKSDGFVTLPPRGAVSTAFPFTPWL
jgi:molybdopterin molybdotransferase